MNKIGRKFNSIVWWSGVVVSTLALINEVSLHWTRLVLRWMTVLGSISSAGHLFQYVTNQPPKADSAFHPSGVGKWVPASAGKAKAGMVHSFIGWTRGVRVKLWDPLRTCAIPERLRCVFTTRRYINPRLPLPLHASTTSDICPYQQLSFLLCLKYYLAFGSVCYTAYVTSLKMM